MEFLRSRETECGYTYTMRIVSLLPSATEIVCALGYGNQLVGRSHECDHPASVTELPIYSRPRIRVDTSSSEIDIIRTSLNHHSSPPECG